MTNANGAVQIETRVKHEFSILFQLVADEQSINVGTLVKFIDFSHIKHRGFLDCVNVPARLDYYANTAEGFDQTTKVTKCTKVRDE
jgi:hypothetical protein